MNLIFTVSSLSSHQLQAIGLRIPFIKYCDCILLTLLGGQVAVYCSHIHSGPLQISISLFGRIYCLQDVLSCCQSFPRLNVCESCFSCLHCVLGSWLLIYESVPAFAAPSTLTLTSETGDERELGVCGPSCPLMLDTVQRRPLAGPPAVSFCEAVALSNARLALCFQTLPASLLPPLTFSPRELHLLLKP